MDIESAKTALDQFEVNYSAFEKEVLPLEQYTKEDFDHDQNLRESLSIQCLLGPNRTESDNSKSSYISSLMSGIETDYFDQKNYKTKPIPLNGVMYKKHKATCSNLLEIYEYISIVGTRKKVLIQKMRDAQSYSTFIRIFKQSNQAKFQNV